MKHSIFLSSLMTVAVPYALFAIEANDNFKITIGGDIEAQYGHVSEKKDFVGQKKKDGMTTSGSLKFNIDKKNYNGFNYGGLIKLNANPSKTKTGKKEIADELKVYLQGNFGKLELGTTKPVGNSMQVNSFTDARATGGIDGDWGLWLKNSSGFLQGSTALDIEPYYTGADFAVNSKNNKINYFSPVFKGFSVGLSFTPDTKTKGTVDSAKQVLKDSCEDGYKNVIQPAVRYEIKANDDLKITSAVVAGFGKSKAHSYKDGSDTKTIDREGLKTWQIGLGANYKAFSLSAAYGDLGQSGTLAKKDRAAANSNKYGGKYWSVGSAYGIDQYGISVNYMQSKRAGYIAGKTQADVDAAKNNSEYNKFNAVSVGADYQIMPGLMPYVEVTRFNFKENKNFGDGAKFNKGTVFLAGTKIKF